MTMNDNLSKSLAPALALLISLPGCPSTTGLPSEVPTTPSVESSTGVATCQAAKDILEPFVVEWPATAKTRLDASLQRGVVIVSYAGCTMKVLDGCEADGSYTLLSTTPVRDTINIDSESKLYAHLPLGAASLKANLKGGGTLALNYVSVGQQTADGPPQRLRGSCDGATHFVRAVTIGAYSLTSSEARSAEGSVDTVWHAGAGAGTESNKKQLRASGNPEVCMTAPDDPGCKAILQVSLMPLPKQTAEAKSDDMSFGTGLGKFTPMPQTPVPEAPTPIIDDTAPGDHDTDLNDADIELLSKVQKAERAERNPESRSEEKYQLWLTVVNHSPDHVYRKQAEQRANQWNEVALAEALRARKAAAICIRYENDAEKLDYIMKYDDNVVSQEQKQAYQQEFDRTYTPYKQVLEDCDTWKNTAQDTWTLFTLARYDHERKIKEAQIARDSAIKEATESYKEQQKEQPRTTQASAVRSTKITAIVSGGILAAFGAWSFFGIGASSADKAKNGCSSGGVCPAPNNDDAKKAQMYGWLGVGGMGLGLALGLGGIFWPMPKEKTPDKTVSKWKLTPGPGDIGMGTGVSF